MIFLPSTHFPETIRQQWAQETDTACSTRSGLGQLKHGIQILINDIALHTTQHRRLNALLHS